MLTQLLTSPATHPSSLPLLGPHTKSQTLEGSLPTWHGLIPWAGLIEGNAKLEGRAGLHQGLIHVLYCLDEVSCSQGNEEKGVGELDVILLHYVLPDTPCESILTSRHLQNATCKMCCSMQHCPQLPQQAWPGNHRRQYVTCVYTQHKLCPSAAPLSPSKANPPSRSVYPPCPRMKLSSLGLCMSTSSKLRLLLLLAAIVRTAARRGVGL